jgi:hypothetical protein
MRVTAKQTSPVRMPDVLPNALAAGFGTKTTHTGAHTGSGQFFKTHWRQR